MAKAQGWGDWAVSGAQLEKEAGKSAGRVDSDGDGKTDSFMQGQCMIRFAFQKTKKKSQFALQRTDDGRRQNKPELFSVMEESKMGTPDGEL